MILVPYEISFFQNFGQI